MSRSYMFLPAFCFFFSGCAMIAPDAEVKPANEEPSAISAAEQIVSSDISRPAESVDNAEGQRPSVEVKTVSQNEVRTLQARLKAAGFDPGAADGVLGPRTRSALQRLQSGCVALRDLWEISEIERQRDMSDAKASAAKPLAKFAGGQEIRLLQVRLKDAGFEPGSIDGILGPKTSAALIRLRSGCSAAKNFPVVPADRASYGDTNTAPAAAKEKRFSTPLEAADGMVSSGSLITEDRPGSAKEEVRRVQAQLKKAGFDPGPIDGIMGPKTRSALLQYQNSLGESKAPAVGSDLAMH